MQGVGWRVEFVEYRCEGRTLHQCESNPIAIAEASDHLITTGLETSTATRGTVLAGDFDQTLLNTVGITLSHNVKSNSVLSDVHAPNKATHSLSSPPQLPSIHFRLQKAGL